jgi:5'(3')-deoxyribonucleotidase
VGHCELGAVPELASVRGDAANLFGTVPIIPGARKVLRRLSTEGYRIRIITHRLFIQYFHEVAVRQTTEWLDKNGIPYWDLCFMKDKDQVGADIYVEDSPTNVLALREAGHYTICFGNSTNRHIGKPKANTWEEVYALVKLKAPEPMRPPARKRTARRA